MENEKINKLKNPIETKKEQTITLLDRHALTVTGTTKVISLKPDLIQLETVFGGLAVLGKNMQLIKLDNISSRAEIEGEIDCVRFVESKSKEPFFRKIFK